MSMTQNWPQTQMKISELHTTDEKQIKIYI